jgi:hypothetical protein
VTKTEKLLTLSQSIEKLQHFEINFDGNNKITLVPSLISIKALFILVTGGLSMKTAIFTKCL